jgi:ATP-dependent Lon protease
MFMTTANVLDTIQPALRDRMEVIRLSGYTEIEKLQIVKTHILKKQMDENGITTKNIAISDSAIRVIINQYTRESGLRQLEREIGSICRKVARKVAEGFDKTIRVTAKNLHEFLGAPKIIPEETLKKDQVGVATGLAWTPVGGEILYIEALLMKGKGGMMLTGQIGDVMKESAHAALSYAKSRSKELNIDEELFNTHDIHVHIPEGAIPKDGPSAGITLVTALVSVLTNRPVRRSVAMTGEVTLRGNVLSIGGLKEKVLAAHRNRIATVIVPVTNRKDLEELPKEVLKEMEFIYVDHVRQVLKVALA